MNISSGILENNIPDYDATDVAKLKEAGAIFLDKENMHEFAKGVSFNNPPFRGSSKFLLVRLHPRWLFRRVGPIPSSKSQTKDKNQWYIMLKITKYSFEIALSGLD